MEHACIWPALSLSLCGRYKTLNPIMCLGVSKVIECFHLCHVRITFCVHHILWFGVYHLLHLQCNIHIYVSCIYTQTVLEYNFSCCVEIVLVVLFTRVGVKYNWSSTQILQVLVIKYTYKYKYFAFSPIKYSSTSSTDTSSTSTSTSTSVNIGWLIYTGNTRAVIPGKYQGGNSREIPPCPMITPVQYP